MSVMFDWFVGTRRPNHLMRSELGLFGSRVQGTTTRATILEAFNVAGKHGGERNELLKRIKSAQFVVFHTCQTISSRISRGYDHDRVLPWNRCKRWWNAEAWVESFLRIKKWSKSNGTGFPWLVGCLIKQTFDLESLHLKQLGKHKNPFYWSFVRSLISSESNNSITIEPMMAKI